MVVRVKKIFTLWVSAAILLWGADGLADESCIIDELGDGTKINTLVGPVISPGPTLSGEYIYLSFFRAFSGRFWEGDLVKLKVSELGEILDKNGALAIGTDNAIKADAVPFWSTKAWADPASPNYIPHLSRNIYTFLGSTDQLTDSSNSFSTLNNALTKEVLGIPGASPLTETQVIDYVRGADVFDEDSDGDTTENRAIITGDILHSEPEAVQYNFPDGTSLVMIFYGANDGMLHAVLDSETDSEGEILHFGVEKWAFIPPDQLHKLGPWVEGEDHWIFVDSSPEVLFLDQDGDSVLEPTDGDRMILVCGLRQGGRGYFALDITEPFSPRFLWRASNLDDQASLNLPPGSGPDLVVPELGETWAEPRFALVKTSEDDQDGTWVVFLGGGYSANNIAGRAVLALDVVHGTMVRVFKNGLSGITQMYYPIPSAVTVVDGDNDGFADKIYVGDTGGRLWRLGRFTGPEGEPLPFPEANEDITQWEAHILFESGPPGERQFFAPPSVTLEKGYDLVFIGSGNKADPCATTSEDRIYAIKDIHSDITLTENDLVDVTSSGLTPNLENPESDVDENGRIDMGWFIRLQGGEKILSKPLVFNKVLYFTTFRPGPDGGTGKIYALEHKTGEPALFGSGADLVRSQVAGKSLPSIPVMFIGEKAQRLLVSTKVTNPGSPSESLGAGILAIKPLMPPSNLFYLWWLRLL